MKKRKVTPKKEFKFAAHHLFTVGLILVVLFTIADPTKTTYIYGTILIFLGLLVGFFDIPRKYSHEFILAMLGIVIVGSAVNFLAIQYKIGSFPLGLYIKALLGNLSIFLSLAVIIVALRTIYRIYLDY